jgi:phage terminase large subunit-like protein
MMKKKCHLMSIKFSRTYTYILHIFHHDFVTRFSPIKPAIEETSVLIETTSPAKLHSAHTEEGWPLNCGYRLTRPSSEL